MQHYKEILKRENNKNISQKEMMMKLEQFLHEKDNELNQKSQNRNQTLGERMQRVRDHLNRVQETYQFVLEDQASGRGLAKQVEITAKLVKGITTTNNNKKEYLDDTAQAIRENHQAKESSVASNKLDLRRQDREKINHYRKKQNERDNSVREIKAAMAEDLDQRKEIARLRKQDRDEFMSRRNHYEQLEKQKIWSSIQEKHARADMIKQEQDRIAALVTAKRSTARGYSMTTLSPRLQSNEKTIRDKTM